MHSDSRHAPQSTHTTQPRIDARTVSPHARPRASRARCGRKPSNGRRRARESISPRISTHAVVAAPDGSRGGTPAAAAISPVSPAAALRLIVGRDDVDVTKVFGLLRAVGLRHHPHTRHIRGAKVHAEEERAERQAGHVRPEAERILPCGHTAGGAMVVGACGHHPVRCNAPCTGAPSTIVFQEEASDACTHRDPSRQVFIADDAELYLTSPHLRPRTSSIVFHGPQSGVAGAQQGQVARAEGRISRRAQGRVARAQAQVAGEDDARGQSQGGRGESVELACDGQGRGDARSAGGDCGQRGQRAGPRQPLRRPLGRARVVVRVGDGAVDRTGRAPDAGDAHVVRVVHGPIERCSRGHDDGRQRRAHPGGHGTRHCRPQLAESEAMRRAGLPHRGGLHRREPARARWLRRRAAQHPRRSRRAQGAPLGAAARTRARARARAAPHGR